MYTKEVKLISAIIICLLINVAIVSYWANQLNISDADVYTHPLFAIGWIIGVIEVAVVVVLYKGVDHAIS